MAKAAFFVNHVKVKRKGDFLLVEARRKCQHGTVFEEVFLTLPGDFDYLFSYVEEDSETLYGSGQKEQASNIPNRLKRFLGEN